MKIHEVIKDLDIKSPEMEDDEIFTDVIVIAKVVKMGDDNPATRTRIVFASTAETDWILRTGLLAAASQINGQSPIVSPDE